MYTRNKNTLVYLVYGYFTKAEKCCFTIHVQLYLQIVFTITFNKKSLETR